MARGHLTGLLDRRKLYKTILVLVSAASIISASYAALLFTQHFPSITGTSFPPAVAPSKHYWGTFYYPWYGNGNLPSLTFTKYPNNPILGDHTEPDIIRRDSTYYLYYRTDGAIGVMTSSDGLSWTDLGTILPKSISGWDSSEVITPSVMLEDGVYYLYYEADDAARVGHRAIGVATSNDPRGPFTKYSGNPVLEPSLSWESSIVGTPVIFKSGPRFFLLYHGYSGGADRVGIAYSSTPVGPWTKEANNPILNLGSSGAWDDSFVAPSSVYVWNRNIWLFYEGAHGTSWRTGLATGQVDSSGRVVSFTRYSPNPIVDLGPSGSWDSGIAQLPGVVYSPETNKLWLYYSGNDRPLGGGGIFRLGRAEASVPETWTHWNERGHNPPDYKQPSTWASIYLPDDGSGIYSTTNLYSSKSTTVLTRHLDWMDRAKLDFALVSWWGQGSYEDQAFFLILANHASHTVKHAVYYEPETLSNPPVSTLVSDLTYIYDSYTINTAYFHATDGKADYPVIFVSGKDEGPEYADRWAEARLQLYKLGKPIFIALKVFPGYLSSANKVDGWHQFAPSVRYELQSGYSAYASPGYSEYPELAVARGRINPLQPLLPRNLTEFRNAVATMAALSLDQAKFLLIETFNEWHEGTQIEPGIAINHLESGFTQAELSYGFTFIDIVAARG